MKFDFDKYIDAKGLKCPQPLLLTKAAINHMSVGDILLLEATDAHTDLDLEVWCERFGHKILHSSEKNNVYRFYLKKQQ